MANPQIENGHARIANELLEALSRFSPGRGEAQVLWAIIRKTYGWNKKRDSVSIGQIAELTGLTRRWVIVCVSNLEAKKMIIVCRQKGRGQNEPNRIEIQKNYDLWVVKEKSAYYRNSLKNHKLRYHKSKAGVVKEKQGSEGKAPKVVKEIEKGSEGGIHPQKTTTTKDNTKDNIPLSESSEQPNGSPEIPETVQQVFNHWNSYAGQSVEKPSGQGGVKLIVWKAHRVLGKDKRLAIEQALKDYSVDDVCGAIDNFAMVLLGHEYFWSYPWSLHEFFTRGEEKHKAAARKWWAWLPDNFDAERYRRQGAADEIHIRDFTPEEDYEYYKQHPNPPMTAEQVNAEREKIGWPALSEAELAELPHTLDGLILVTADVREKWSAEYLERRKATVS